jgi:hypothetical protein
MAFSPKLLQQGSSGASDAKNYIDDVFSTYLYTGTASVQTIINDINLGATYSSGSVYFDGTADGLQGPTNESAFQFGTGDFTVECWIYQTATNTYPSILEIDDHVGAAAGILFIAIGGGIVTAYNGTAGFISTATAPSLNTWNHIAWVRSSGVFKIYVNGVGNTGVSFTQNLNTSATVTIGSEKNLNGSYTYNGFISNLRVVKGTAVYTSNFTPSTTELTAISGTSLLIGQGNSPLTDKSSNAYNLTVIGQSTAKPFGPFSTTAGKGGMFLIKGRSGDYSSFGTRLVDTVRGSAELVTTSSGASSDQAGAYTFNSNGFTLPGSGYNGVNGTNTNYVSWTFREQPKFFDIVTYIGNGATNRQIPHSLTSIPGFIVAKSASGSGNWWAGHRSLGFTRTINFDGSTPDSGISIWDGSPTSTTFTVQPNINADGVTYVAYLFAHEAGGFGSTGTDNVISCGSFVGNGTTTAVNLGFEPQWVMIRASSTTDDWRINDSMRGVATNGVDKNLAVNLTNSEYGSDDRLDFNATGFTAKLNNNSNGETYIYMAIRRPMKVPTDATSVFSLTARAGNATVTNVPSGFPTDVVFARRRDTLDNANESVFASKLLGTATLSTNTTAAEYAGGATSGLNSYTNTGVVIGTNNAPIYAFNYTALPYLLYQFRRASKFFDEVCVTPSYPTPVSHNLGAVPKLRIEKPRGSIAEWKVLYYDGITDEYELALNSTRAASIQSGRPGLPTATTFISFWDGTPIVAYLFAPLAGIQYISKFTGNGSSQTINCGFTNGARFVCIKAFSTTGDWKFMDTARGIVAGNDRILAFNTTTTEGLSTDCIDPASSGFIINQETTNNLNVNGVEYLVWAIA